jgi:hypothetical protein
MSAQRDFVDRTNPQNITKSEPRTPAAVDEVPRQKKKPKTVNNVSLTTVMEVLPYDAIPQELQGKSGQKKKSKETTSGTSKDEATIKRLKVSSFVLFLLICLKP